MNTSILAATVTLAIATPVWAQAWLDNFNDGNFSDNAPVSWSPAPFLPAAITIVNGDLHLALPALPAPPYVGAAAASSSIFSSGVSVRARMIMTNGPGRAAVGFADAATGLVGYVAAFNTCNSGRLELWRNDGTTTITYLGAGNIAWPYDPTVEHYIQLDVFGGVVSMRVWRPGEPFPPVPQIQAVDANYSVGAVGVAVQDFGEGNCSGIGNVTDATVTVRFVQASSTPLTHSGIGDVTADGVVDVNDLLAIITAWGPCLACSADANGDGSVDVVDLLLVISNWG